MHFLYDIVYQQQHKNRDQKSYLPGSSLKTNFRTDFLLQNNPFNLCMLMSSQRIFLVKKLILTANPKVSGIEKKNHFKSRFFLLIVRIKLYLKYFKLNILSQIFKRY